MFLVFDLDQTLADLYSIYPFLVSLQMNRLETNITSRLERELKEAYSLFVKMICEMECSHSLGLLRPGILSIMKQCRTLQKQGKIHSIIIYSNNGYLPHLHLVRDIIHHHVGSNHLISDCIHLHHPTRNEEKKQYLKTWNVLRALLPVRVNPSQVYFFDDQSHPDLESVLRHHYISVPPYSFRASFEKISGIFYQTLKEIDIDLDHLRMFISFIFPIANHIHDPFEAIIQSFKSMTKKTEEIVPEEDSDEGISKMKTVLKTIMTKRRKTYKRISLK
jgi:hypothetical protein